ncbi:T9SS type A sorting domain-containing protein [Lutibacter sp.]|uniref:T9SS type A sorting domain-containing protein n=1 Tax=Lutibacter sp. TaxID=1925666 RepID=UPI001A1981B6|nr:T9SS type A sorting domain-containing protein [Lutibacter sp.]MBI9042681.1 T9SS type A sorting domain-containing protein [Lutibacter sp.]
MKQKLRLVIPLILLCFQFANAQYSSSNYLVRSTTGVAGSSEAIIVNNQHYVIQQSIGQGSVIGKFQSNGVIVRQGFIQPPTISSKIIPEETNLNAMIYPNPVNNELNVSFNELVKGPITIQIFDMLGRNVFTKKSSATQNMSINLGFLASAQYIFLMNTEQKQFKANIIKR